MLPPWTPKQTQQHKKAAALLTNIAHQTFAFAKEGITEYELQHFVLNKYQKYRLVSDKDPPIVAFGRNTNKPHHFPKKTSLRLRREMPVLIDLWAHLREPAAPFADITWMGYCGKIPSEFQKNFSRVLAARDACVRAMRKGAYADQIDQAAREELGNLARHFTHSTGHPLGTTSPHGNCSGLRHSNHTKIRRRIAYSIEPGIYLQEYGIRTEINALLDKKLIITTPVQRRLIHI